MSTGWGGAGAALGLILTLFQKARQAGIIGDPAWARYVEAGLLVSVEATRILGEVQAGAKDYDKMTEQEIRRLLMPVGWDELVRRGGALRGEGGGAPPGALRGARLRRPPPPAGAAPVGRPRRAGGRAGGVPAALAVPRARPCVRAGGGGVRRSYRTAAYRVPAGRPRLGDIADILRPGMVLLVSKRGLFRRIVRAVTGSHWTHAALIDHNAGGLWIVIEAVAAGGIGPTR